MSTSGVQKEVRRRVLRALDDDEVMDFGTVLAQQHGRSLSATIPSEVVRQESLQQSSELAVGYHPATGSIILTPE